MATKYKRTENQRSIDRLYDFAIWCKTTKLVKTINEWEVKCGLGARYLTNTVLSAKGSVGADILDKVYRTYPMLNLSWVITGEGGMLVLEKHAKYEKAIIDELERKRTELEDQIIELARRRDQVAESYQSFTELVEAAKVMRKALRKIPK